MLAAFFVVLLHVLLIGSMLAFVVCSLLITLTANGWVERLIRFGAFFSGALVVLGTRVSGVDFSGFIAESLSSSGVVVAAGGVAAPGALGAGLGYLLVSGAHRGGVFVIRIMVFVGTLAATQFAEIYVESLEVNGASLGSSAAPNISFVLGILLCIALTYDPQNPDRSRMIFREMTKRPAGDPPPTGPENLGAQPGRTTSAASRR